MFYHLENFKYITYDKFKFANKYTVDLFYKFGEGEINSIEDYCKLISDKYYQTNFIDIVNERHPSNYKRGLSKIM